MKQINHIVMHVVDEFHVESHARTVASLRAAGARTVDLLRLVGFKPRTLQHTLTGLPKYINDAYTYARQLPADDSFAIRGRDLYPILGESHAEAGEMTFHYFHQDLWAARKIFQKSPTEHFDVGSRIDGFVAHVLTFMPVTVIDVRPLVGHVDGLRFIRGDATQLSGIPDASLASVSSLHAVEHFGLGRYGDPVDPGAAEKAMAALSRVLAPGGRLYFSVPIGRERLMFNAHRIFSPATVLRVLAPLQLISFAAIDDAGHFHREVEPADFQRADYSCGLFEFGKS
jgi:SAM-dependent methyltransferase